MIVHIYLILSSQTTEWETTNPERKMSSGLFHNIAAAVLGQRMRLWLRSVPAQPSACAGDSGSTLAFVPWLNSIFFLVILLPLLNTAALSDLSPHKLPFECQSYNSDAVVAMATSESLHLRLLGKHHEPATGKKRKLTSSPFYLFIHFQWDILNFLICYAFSCYLGGRIWKTVSKNLIYVHCIELSHWCCQNLWITSLWEKESLVRDSDEKKGSGYIFWGVDIFQTK